MKEDLNSKTSERKGIAGILETTLRSFRIAAYFAILIPICLIGISAMSISAAPGIFFFKFILEPVQCLHLVYNV